MGHNKKPLQSITKSEYAIMKLLQCVMIFKQINVGRLYAII